MSPLEEKAAFRFLSLGAIVQEFRVAGHNIVLGFPTEQLYRKYNAPYFGATIGRTTNRLKDATIGNVNGRSYKVTTARGPHSLHGGRDGWNAKLFDGPNTVKKHDREGFEFKYLSRHGDEGYPGTVELRVWYSATEEVEEGKPEKTVLEVDYEVEFVGDECEETVVGVTNHRKVDYPYYFNLGECPTIEGTEAVLETDKYLPTDPEGIPTGTIEHYTATEVKKPFFLSETSPDIDDCFVMDTDPSSIPLDTRTRPMKLLASFKHLTTGLHLEVHSTEPAFQFYTGKYINVPAVRGMPARGPRSGFCVEPSRYVNAPNKPEWRVFAPSSPSEDEEQARKQTVNTSTSCTGPSFSSAGCKGLPRRKRVLKPLIVRSSLSKIFAILVADAQFNPRRIQLFRRSYGQQDRTTLSRGSRSAEPNSARHSEPPVIHGSRDPPTPTMCRQLYNQHSCDHTIFVRTKTCGKKQYCPVISREPTRVHYICHRCAATILMSMRSDNQKAM
ncbi:conserved hypothetical protein [Uncinocarpus reesii 1704]|uniref:Aldose 1-epimerase n=1 Tax=Uncinocarpus reesii (strain UAMH 1704) TaxID=336963 RepID=C4JWL0_UNCRE|nr:uncharacterized protein UREG_06952 [Uncinocarpus reesii 1704]EEP82087.1 conserved hypothetical protein [Uncinocarpus reesii 1704]